MMRFVALIGLFVFGSLGCAEPQSPRCKTVCEREAECIEQIADEDQRPSFEKRECITDCTNLIRDKEGKDLVEGHLACAQAAPDCKAVLACP